jgi:hypothetical protein
MKKTLRYTKNPENIQNPIVNQLPVTRWDLLKKRLADLIKIVTRKSK